MNRNTNLLNHCFATHLRENDHKVICTRKDRMLYASEMRRNRERALKVIDMELACVFLRSNIRVIFNFLKHECDRYRDLPVGDVRGVHPRRLRLVRSPVCCPNNQGPNQKEKSRELHPGKKFQKWAASETHFF